MTTGTSIDIWSVELSSVIVDTSEWVQFFRVGSSSEAEEVRRLLQNHEVTMVGVVYAELLRGARNDAQFQTLEDQLNALPFVETNKVTWRSAGRILARLQSQGMSIPLPDALIGAIAVENGLSVFSRDEHFSRVPELQLHTI